MTYSEQVLGTENPSVSVLITVYNGMPLIRDTVESLLEQTYTDIELVIVDDGSTDDTVEELSRLAEIDGRVRYFTPGRLGRGKALNFGLKHIRGNLVAINDADDLSHPERISKQVEFMNRNPDYGLVGTFFETIDMKTGAARVTRHPTGDAEMRLAFTSGQCMQHSTVMFRREILEKINGYDENRKFLFDRDVFLRAAQHTKIANIPDILVTMRHHVERFFYFQYTSRRREIQHHMLRLRAVKIFKFPVGMYVKPLMGLIAAFLPLRVRNIIPRNIRKRIDNTIIK